MWPTVEETDLATEVRRVAERNCPLEELRAHPDAPTAVHEAAWKTLATQLGVAGLAVPEQLGGAGADLGALAVVARELGRAVAAVPFTSTVLAVDLLVRLGDAELAPQVASGGLAVAVAGPLDGSPPGVEADSSVLTGAVAGVVDGLGAELLLVPARIGGEVAVFAVAADDPGVTRRQLRTLDLGRPQASVELSGAGGRRVGVGPAGSALAGTARLARLLLAAEQCGVAERAFEIAVAHAKVRSQFGRPIGAFQAIKHLCADLFVRTELAAALLGEAVEVARADEGGPEAALAIWAAAVGCSEAALAVTSGAIAVLGGIGFTWEHDAHLYFRRARANAVAAGPIAAAKDAVAGLLLAGADGTVRPEPNEGAPGEFSERVRAWFVENTTVPELGRGGSPAAEARHLTRGREYRRALVAAGLAGITVPVEYGGAGLTAAHESVVVAARRGREIFDDVFGVGVGMCVPVLLTLGTNAQKQRYLPPLLRGDEIWCQLFSEPEAGSDLAGLRTRAVRDGDGWVVTGQKVWTTYAQHADFALLLARTDPDVPKHDGLTMFVVDMKAAGINVRPLRQITGDSEFNEVFLDGVVLPADAVVGAVNSGWRAAMVMLMNERVAIGRDPLIMSPPVTFGRLRELVRDRGLDSDRAARARLADVYVLERSLVLVGAKVTALLRPGEEPGPFAAVCKLGAVFMAPATTETAFELAGPGAAAWDPADVDAGVWAYSVLFAPAMGIAGGTDQIQRTIIGERVLGLPRG